MIFKYIYISRQKRIVNIDILIANLIKVKKREKQISLVTSNKKEAYKENGALQITFYQWLNNTYRKHTEWREKDFLFYIFFSFACFVSLRFGVLLYSHQIGQNQIIKRLFSQWQSLFLNNNVSNVFFFFLIFLLSYLSYCTWLYFSVNLFCKKRQKNIIFYGGETINHSSIYLLFDLLWCQKKKLFKYINCDIFQNI